MLFEPLTTHKLSTIMENSQEQQELKAKISQAKLELEKLDKAIDDSPTTKAVTDCTCNNPGCSGAEVITYAAAVGGAFAGGIS